MADEPRPIELDTLERNGASRFGRAIAKVILITEDNRRISIDLPREVATNARQERIIDFIASSPAPLTRKQVAMKLNKGNITGRFGQDISFLISSGRLVERDGELADSVEKFSAIQSVDS